MAEVMKRYLDGHGIDYRLRVVGGPTIAAQDAATQLHVQLSTIMTKME